MSPASSSYTVEIAPAARRQLKKLPKSIQRRIVALLDDLVADPRPPGTKKLAGGESLYRQRLGDYRVVYRIEDRKLWVLVVKVGTRKEIYRRLLRRGRRASGSAPTPRHGGRHRRSAGRSFST
ncbi:MAG: type II toxin-antitoxin system RelE/ParE family toxin [bacterium]|nr:type II toxin-antitoxin system RelE/ParE family toxin [bacterium]